MAENSKIEWTDATWNPLRAREKATGKVGWHCELYGPGCAHCYAQRINGRGLIIGTGLPYTRSSRDQVETFVDYPTLIAPLHWKKRRMVFVCSMTDLFGEWVSDEQIVQVFAVMYECQWHTFQVLTKRADRMQRFLTSPHVREEIATAAYALALQRKPEIAELVSRDDTLGDVCDSWPFDHVWLGISAEDQERFDERAEHLSRTPAAVRFISYEPALGPIDAEKYLQPGRCQSRQPDSGIRCGLPEGHDGHAHTVLIPTGAPWYRVDHISWVIVGGESGPGARPMHPQWARDIRDQCQAAGVPFFFKQWGEWAPTTTVDGRQELPFMDYDTTGAQNHFGFNRVGKTKAGRLLDGREWSEFPKAVQDA